MADAFAPGAMRRDYSVSQLKLIRRNIARNCTDAEFDEFIAFAAQCNLDPIRRQITPLIISPDNPNKRKLICWATIDGLRIIAARQGDYRPMETAPIIDVDAARIDAETNPHGLVRAEVCAWKLRDSVWFPVVGEAWWDEYAPITETAENDSRAQPSVMARRQLAPSWRRMGRVMIAKCAEAQALRRGWPDLLSGLYGQEELHSLVQAERTASEALRVSAMRDARRAETRVLWFVLEPGKPLTPIKLDEAYDVVLERYRCARDLGDLEWFNAANKVSMQTLWDWAPGPAFELKVFAEACAADFARRPRPSGALNGAGACS